MLLCIMLPLFALAEEGKTVIVCMGDSITFGAGVTGPENTYPGKLQSMLGDGYDVRNFGENGRTLLLEGTLDANMNTLMTYQGSGKMKAALKKDPQIVMIMLGTNDAKSFNWNAEEYTRQYIEMVRGIQARESVQQVYVMIPPPGFDPHEGYQTVTEIDRDILANEVDSCVRKVAQECGCGIIDLYSALVDRGDLFPDGIHPNAEGNEIIAQTIYEAMKLMEHPDYLPEVEEDPNVKYQATPSALTTDFAKHTPIRLWRKNSYLPYAGSSSIPTIMPYLVESDEPVGCVLIFPGGAYGMLTTVGEGTAVAEYINKNMGLSAFVVKYRVAPNNYRAILTDALRAIRFVRYYAETLNICPDQVAVMGFSAGGHLAMMTAEHFDYGKTGDAIDAISSRPDAAFLNCPVGSFVSEYTHAESRANFLGEEDTQENRIRFSAEFGLRPDMPPVYINHSEDDPVVPIENSYTTVEAMEAAGLSITYQWNATGGHGYGITDPAAFVLDWPQRLQAWLSDLGFAAAK